MKNWKKVLFNILGCVLFLFIGGIALGIILEDNELAFSICLKIILGYVFILSFTSFIKKAKETMIEIKKQKVKAIITPITWSITTLPYITLWGILVALAFKNILNIALTVTFISFAIYIIIILITGTVLSNDKDSKKEKKDEIDKMEKDFINNKTDKE